MNLKNIHTAQTSLVGKRKNNQDRAIIEIDQETILLVVADGLGGHPKGEVAAQILIDGASHLFKQAKKPLQEPEQFMQACITYSHNAIVRYGNMQTPSIHPRTTAVIAIIQNDLIYWLHVGDSRLYLLRDNKILTKTKDHSVAQMMNSMIASGHQVPKKRYKNAVTRCLGGVEHEPSSTLSAPHSIQQGDVVILCTDGFWGQLNEDYFVEKLCNTASLQLSFHELAKQAVKMAETNSDNVTIAGLYYANHEMDEPKEPSADTGTTKKPDDKELDSAIKNLLGMINRDQPK